MDILLFAEQMSKVEGPHKYTGHWLNHCAVCRREIRLYWVWRGAWPPVRDLCLGCALSYEPEPEERPPRREVVEPVNIGYMIRDGNGKLVESGECTEGELELIRKQTGLLFKGYRIVAIWPPRGPAWQSTGTVERLMEERR